MTDAVIFDLDGVLIESEQLWDVVRREVVSEHGGEWKAGATEAMQGMSAPEWARYMRDDLGVPADESRINDLVLAKLFERYRAELPLLPGAVEAVKRVGSRWRLGLASSSNRSVIDQVLELAGLVQEFEVTLSTEEVAKGKPSPDVYEAVAERLGCPTSACVAVEDSANGIRSAAAAGARVIAIPNREYPPPPDVMDLAALRLDDLSRLTPEAVERVGDPARSGPDEERIDEAERESFPASDPHADWAGPAV